jgi:hypothetical protein
MSFFDERVEAYRRYVGNWEQLPYGWQDDLFAKCELVACVSDIISDVTLAVAVAVANEFKSVEDRSKVMDAAARARDEFKGSEGE